MSGPQLAQALAECLHATWGRPVVVGGLTTATAGARRQNVVFEADDGDTTHRLVATILPPGETALNSIAVEAALRRLAGSAGVPVPHVHAVDADGARLGSPFMISAFVAGETVPRRVLRMAAEHGVGERIVRQLGEALGRLHALDVAAAPVGIQTVEGVPAEFALAAREAELAEMPQPRPALAYGMRWLERHLPPPPARSVIVHTDARNGNLVAGPDGLRAVLDWEGAAAGGDPMQDLAWTAVRTWRFREDEHEIGGLAGRQPLIAGYEAAGGAFDLDRFRWWKVHGTLWWAVGLASQSIAYLDGRVPSIVMAGSGRRVPELEWDLLMLTRPR
jgi:aminoglycoside phosphotransferase (APT) family kinase protein